MNLNQRGIDYASVDENAPPDFLKARGWGAEFVIIRKGFVLYDVKHQAWHLAVDQNYSRDVEQARAGGLTVGSYGFFAFNQVAPSAADQVANLVHGAGGVVRGKDLPYCIDVEFPGRGIVDTGRTQAAAFAFLLELVAEVRKQAGVSPIIYTSHGQWHDSTGLGGPVSSVLDGCPLWLKTPYRLQARQPVDPTHPRLPHAAASLDDQNAYWRIPAPWEKQGWWLHQYQGDATGMPGFSMTVDVSHFPVLIPSQPAETGKVAWVQHRLCVNGETVKVDGIWGPITDAALRAFQRSHNLTVNGAVDVATFASLCW